MGWGQGQGEWKDFKIAVGWEDDSEGDVGLWNNFKVLAEHRSMNMGGGASSA